MEVCLRRPSRLVLFVFLLGVRGQQHPQRVNSERGPEWNVEEQRNNTEYDGEHSRPRLPVEKSPTREESASRFCDGENPHCREQWMEEKGNILYSPTSEDGVGKDDHNNSANRIESRKREPENPQQADMSSHSARTRGGERNRPANLFPTLTAKRLRGLKFGAALIAKHGCLHSG